MHAVGSGALMKVVDVLGAEIEPLTQFLFDYCKSNVSTIRLGSESIATAHGVEPPDEFRIGVPGFGCRNLLDTIPIPKPAGAPKGSKPTLSGDAGPGEDKEAIMESQMHNAVTPLSAIQS
jgi:hypothetical protein